MKRKTFSQIASQIERIYTLYLKGYGSKSLLERAERVFNAHPNIGLCF